jgi:hypothetical protein
MAKQASGSFLKKRTKKLLFHGSRDTANAPVRPVSFVGWASTHPVHVDLQPVIARAAFRPFRSQTTTSPPLKNPA